MLIEAMTSGKSLLELLLSKSIFNAGSGSEIQTMQSTAGEKYLIISVRTSSSGGVSNAGISSGATVDYVMCNNIKNINGSQTLYIAIVTATGNKITMLGSNNVSVYMPLN